MSLILHYSSEIYKYQDSICLRRNVYAVWSDTRNPQKTLINWNLQINFPIFSGFYKYRYVGYNENRKYSPLVNLKILKRKNIQVKIVNRFQKYDEFVAFSYMKVNNEALYHLHIGAVNSVSIWNHNAIIVT